MADTLKGRHPEREQGNKPKHGRPKDDRQHNTMSFAAVQSKKGPGRPDNKRQGVNNLNQNSNRNRNGQRDSIGPSQRNGGGTRSPKLCIFCAKPGHPHWTCPMSARERTQVILRSNRCTRCLEEGHFNSSCRAEGCRKCGNMHHTFLHYDAPRKQGQPRYQIQQRAGPQPPHNAPNTQPPMTAAAYSPGYMVTGNPGSPSMCYGHVIPDERVRAMCYGTAAAAHTMAHPTYRQRGNGRQNGNAQRPLNRPGNRNGRALQGAAPTPQNRLSPIQEEGRLSPRQMNSQIVSFSDARPAVTTNPGGSDVQLMSRVVKAINPDAPRQIEMNAGLMLDPGSTGTYISSELSHKLRLYNGPKKDIGLIRFGDKSASAQIKGTLNVLGVRDVEGNIMRIRGIVVPEFLPSLPCVSVRKEDLDQLRECGAVPPRRTMKPGILLGMDYLHHLKLKFRETYPVDTQSKTSL